MESKQFSVIQGRHCDACRQPILSFPFLRCTVCSDYDLCGPCALKVPYSHAEHQLVLVRFGSEFKAPPPQTRVLEWRSRSWGNFFHDGVDLDMLPSHKDYIELQLLVDLFVTGYQKVDEPPNACGSGAPTLTE